MKVWTYWHDLNDVPPFIHLCFMTMKKHLKDPNFDLRILDKKSLLTILPDLREDLWDLKNEKDLSNNVLHIAAQSDYFRTLLLKRFGGVWIDADTIVIKSFDYIQYVYTMGYDFAARLNESGYISVSFMFSQAYGEVVGSLLNLQDLMLNAKKIIPSGSSFASRPLTGLCLDCGLPFKQIQSEMICPIVFKEWSKYFDTTIEIPLSAGTMSFCLYNRAFPKFFREMPEEKILGRDWLISKIFRYSLGFS